ncbi:MAG: hypothetical protein Cons2KO_18100 [Congregibacter sp.]
MLRYLKLVGFVLGFMMSVAASADAVWIDVRTAAEHLLDSIEGDIRIPHGEILEEVQQRYPDRDTEIALYCRGGGRAEMAAEALRQAGYRQVINAGGIDDARRLRNIDE